MAHLLATIHYICGNQEAKPSDFLLNFKPSEPDPADIHLKLRMVMNRVRERERRARASSPKGTS